MSEAEAKKFPFEVKLKVEIDQNCNEEELKTKGWIVSLEAKVDSLLKDELVEALRGVLDKYAKPKIERS